MAFRNKEGMAISYDCEELIAELKADIAEFGEDEKVNVWCREHEGVTLYTNYDFIAEESTVKKEELKNGETLTVMKMGVLLKLLEQENSIL